MTAVLAGLLSGSVLLNALLAVLLRTTRRQQRHTGMRLRTVERRLAAYRADADREITDLLNGEQP